MASKDSFGAKSTLDVDGKSYEIFRLDAVTGDGLDVASLPFSLKVLLENLLRTEDGADITADDIRALAGWDADAEPDKEIQFTPARVIMQDFTGVPCVVDLATMREAMADLGGDPTKINPLAPGRDGHRPLRDRRRLRHPGGLRAQRRDRVRAQPRALPVPALGPGRLRRLQGRPAGHRHRAPGQHRAPGPHRLHPRGRRRACRPTPTPASAPTPTPRWSTASASSAGASAASRPRPRCSASRSRMLIPRVVGFKLTGDLPEGATATDLVLTITEMLRKHGVVGKFVEFYGPGVSALPLANRATIGNMSPEFGSTIAIFPIDEQTIDYLAPHRPLRRAARAGRGLRQGAGPLARPGRRAALLREARARPRHRRPERSPARSARRTGSRCPTPSSFRSAWPTTSTRVPGRDGEASRAFPASDPTDGTARPRQRLAADGGRRATRRRDLEDGTSSSSTTAPSRSPRSPRCTNTSNPSVMIGAALLAKKAVEKGLHPQAVGQDHAGARLARSSGLLREVRPHAVPRQARLQPRRLRLHHLHRQLRPAHPRGLSQAVNDGDLAVVSVLSGNRNFEGRINPDVKMNYLASPPLVVAYALAGSMDVDLFNDPLGQDERRQRRLPEGHLALADGDRGGHRRARSPPRCSATATTTSSPATSRWRSLPTPEGNTFAWDEDSTYVRKPPYFDGMPDEPEAGHRHRGRAGAAQARRLGHHRPHQPGRRDQEGQPGRPLPRRARRRAARLQLLRLAPRQPRGDDPRHLRQHPAAQPARPGHRGRRHPRLHRSDDGPVTSVYEASENYLEAGTPLVVLAGKEYGSGSSRDWAAKGTSLLGVKAVIAESYERIHRSNLIGMGVMPAAVPARARRPSRSA